MILIFKEGLENKALRSGLSEALGGVCHKVSAGSGACVAAQHVVFLQKLRDSFRSGGAGVYKRNAGAHEFGDRVVKQGKVRAAEDQRVDAGVLDLGEVVAYKRFDDYIVFICSSAFDDGYKKRTGS